MRWRYCARSVRAVDAILSRERFCRAVEHSLQTENPHLAVSCDIDGDHFVIVLTRRRAAPLTWRWPVDEPAYDAWLGEPWSETQAHYLAVLATEENSTYIHRVGDG